jgi:AraC-like DNA-binding protein
MTRYQPVKYQEYRPAPQLVPFIDCYWTSRAGNSQEACVRRIIPDICADIILNLGEEVLVWNGQNHWMKSEKAYLVGTMTTFQDTQLQPGANLVGIRFKPFGLGALLGIHLQGATNQIEELDRKTFSLDYGYCYSLGTPEGHVKAMERLDAYFLRRVSGQDISRMNHLIGTILDAQGQISVGELAQQYHTTDRQLERKFSSIVGVTLKEICNLTRFQHAYQLIRNRKDRSLLDIAFEAGYYDHAHLTKHVKRYAGCLPSQL